MVQKKNKTAAQLVKEAIPARSGLRWQDELSTKDRIFVERVIGELLQNPDAAYCLVAKSLIAELSIKRSVTTVARTLKEMCCEAQQIKHQA